MNVQCNLCFYLIWRMYIYLYNYFKYTVRRQKLLGSARNGSTILSYQNCVITLSWRLMRTEYRTCFHALYDEIYIYICVCVCVCVWSDGERSSKESVLSSCLDDDDDDDCLPKAKEVLYQSYNSIWYIHLSTFLRWDFVILILYALQTAIPI